MHNFSFQFLTKLMNIFSFRAFFDWFRFGILVSFIVAKKKSNVDFKICTWMNQTQKMISKYCFMTIYIYFFWNFCCTLANSRSHDHFLCFCLLCVRFCSTEFFMSNFYFAWMKNAAGQERFRSVTHAYYRDAHGELIWKFKK